MLARCCSQFFISSLIVERSCTVLGGRRRLHSYDMCSAVKALAPHVHVGFRPQRCMSAPKRPIPDLRRFGMTHKLCFSFGPQRCMSFQTPTEQQFQTPTVHVRTKTAYSRSEAIWSDPQFVVTPNRLRSGAVVLGFNWNWLGRWLCTHSSFQASLMLYSLLWC